jgi:hypothetical protein
VLATAYNRGTATWLPLRQRANQHEFYCDGTERLRLDASGNLGLGVTPSALDNNFLGLQVGNSAYLISGNNQFSSFAVLSSNAFYDTLTSFKYKNTGFATRYQQNDGQHRWFTAPSGTAGNAITFTEAMTLDASGNLGVGTTSPETILHVAKASSGGLGAQFVLDNTAGSALNNAVEISFLTDGGASATGTRNARIRAVNQSAGDGAANLQFWTWNGAADAERARITSGGDFLVGKTSTTFSTAGATIYANGAAQFTVNANEVLDLNRLSSDGTLQRFFQDSVEEGSISVSGNTVSYNAFAGSHWSQLQDGSKPDILRGTVMESINELCEWPGEENERLPKSKISDTAGSKKVYGVFMAWDNDWTETNDMYVTAVGAFICRVNAGVTVQEGDLLESNGDGTARVQADDIIRSSTIGKVTSTVKTHEYDDGSYCVPTVLYCG